MMPSAYLKRGQKLKWSVGGLFTLPRLRTPRPTFQRAGLAELPLFMKFLYLEASTPLEFKSAAKHAATQRAFEATLRLPIGTLVMTNAYQSAGRRLGVRGSPKNATNPYSPLLCVGLLLVLLLLVSVSG
jgi:hypothetical protein